MAAESKDPKIDYELFEQEMDIDFDSETPAKTEKKASK